VEVLRSAGWEVFSAPTASSAGTGEQVRHAIADGCDTVFACGGDGTIHDVLQALVGTQAILGIIPLGTANALAHDLRIPLSAAAAARTALASQPRRIAAGKVTFQNFSGACDCRYFTVAAGVGVDAHLFYKLNVLIKGRFGMLAYYLKATRLWLTHDMRTFNVGISRPDADPSSVHRVRQDEVSQFLAVRITQFGGVLRELAPGASLSRNDLRVVLFKTQNRILYLAYVLRGMLGLRWAVSNIELADAKKVMCTSSNSKQNSRVFVEADGELLGTLPAEISVIPDAVTLLVPKT
jgi:YegS/Rv2252/BmrU family lipid kinase